MAVTSVRALFNGVWYDLTFNAATGLYEAVITAPTTPANNVPLTIWAVNENGYQAEKTITLDVHWELIPPTIQIISPAEGGWYSNSRQPVLFTLRDEENGSGINLSTLSFVLDGNMLTSISPGMVCTPVTNGYDCTYNPPTALYEGNHTVSITVFDLAGNQSNSASRSWNIDTANPALEVTYPPNNLITNQPKQTVVGTVEDTGIGLESFTINGNQVAIAGNAFSYPMTLQEGTNTITIIAKDKLGHISTIARSVLVDTVAPEFISVHIAPDMEANPLGDSFVITVVLAESAVSPSSKETLTGILNGTPILWTEGPELTWTAKTSRADSDTYTLELLARDTAGNATGYEITFPCGMESKWTWTELEYLNSWDLNRVERNTNYIYKWLKQRGYGAGMLTIKTDWITDCDGQGGAQMALSNIPNRSDIDRIRQNVDYLKDSFFRVPEWKDIVYNNTVDAAQMNAIEWDLHLMDLWLDKAAKTIPPYSDMVYSGMFQ